MNDTTPGPDAAGAQDRPHAFSDLAAAPVPWTHDSGGDADDRAAATEPHADAPDDTSLQRLLFVRVIVRRNFADAPFWVSCPPGECEALVRKAQAQARSEHLTEAYRLAALSPEDIGILRERMLLPEHPVSFPGTRDFKHVFLAGDRHATLRTHALLGEVEHWTRIHTLGPHYRPATLRSPSPPEFPLEALCGIARRAAGDTHARPKTFAYADPWGFLTSNPAHAGTGLQFEAGLHLPALSALGARTALMQTARALAATGYELQALSLREPGVAAAGFFRLVSRGGAWIAEEEQAVDFMRYVGTVLRAERDAWTDWNAREAAVVEDRMHRALRILQEARRLEQAEAQSLISFARAGVYAGAFPVSLLPKLETLRVQAQPFHIRALMVREGVREGEDGAASPDGAAAIRAGLARRLLSSE